LLQHFWCEAVSREIVFPSPKNFGLFSHSGGGISNSAALFDALAILVVLFQVCQPDTKQQCGAAWMPFGCRPGN
jgi:hypothetical protein